jgi:hypothetical protein
MRLIGLGYPPEADGKNARLGQTDRMGLFEPL